MTLYVVYSEIKVYKCLKIRKLFIHRVMYPYSNALTCSQRIIISSVRHLLFFSATFHIVFDILFSNNHLYRLSFSRGIEFTTANYSTAGVITVICHISQHVDLQDAAGQIFSWQTLRAIIVLVQHYRWLCG